MEFIILSRFCLVDYCLRGHFNFIWLVSCETCSSDNLEDWSTIFSTCGWGLTNSSNFRFFWEWYLRDVRSLLFRGTLNSLSSSSMKVTICSFGYLGIARSRPLSFRIIGFMNLFSVATLSSCAAVGTFRRTVSCEWAGICTGYRVFLFGSLSAAGAGRPCWIGCYPMGWLPNLAMDWAGIFATVPWYLICRVDCGCIKLKVA